MTDKERLEIIATLAFSAREHIVEAEMGTRESFEALKTADLLLLAATYIKHYKEPEEQNKVKEE